MRKFEKYIYCTSLSKVEAHECNDCNLGHSYTWSSI